MLAMSKRTTAAGLFAAGVVFLLSADLVAAEVARTNRDEARSARVSALEHRLSIRRIDSRIKLLDAEREAYRRQLKRLGPSSVFRYSTAFVWTVEETRLAILKIEQELEELSDEKFLLQQDRARDRLTIAVQPDKLETSRLSTL